MFWVVNYDTCFYTIYLKFGAFGTPNPSDVGSWGYLFARSGDWYLKSSKSST